MTAIAQRLALAGEARSAGRRLPPAVAHAARCALVLAVVLAGGVHLADAGDWSGLARSRALLETARMRAADAERVLAAAARHRGPPPVPAPTHGDRSAHRPEWAELMLELADLAASSGLRIVSIEPQRPDEAAPDGRRAVRLVADGGFPALLRTIDGLAGLPVLAVPTALRIERAASMPRVDMSLDLFPALPGLALAGLQPAAPVPGVAPDRDPFGRAEAFAAGGGRSPRLAGVIRDARAALALFDDGDGAFMALAPGDALGASQVARVDARTVTLATVSGPKRFVLDDGGRP
ncbi:pilus assembly protein [Burkholderia pseudomultivorans]|uniref:pilus assembly protein n=1 Tax=Burkholderia pseudomultivorans TaxID=1207504 RepID=UPI00188DCCC0|nr:pilus assembly protein [Burkholderia pseudomultivorans]MBF5009248.1 pilus assembly protein [Burkholderia pseudomultivorans]